MDYNVGQCEWSILYRAHWVWRNADSMAQRTKKLYRKNVGKLRLTFPSHTLKLGITTHSKGKQMNVNQIELTRNTRVESDTDAYHILSSQFQLDQYVQQFGNVEVVWDDEWTVYRVPSLDAKRNQYCEAKTRDCARWGCE